MKNISSINKRFIKAVEKIGLDEIYAIRDNKPRGMFVDWYDFRLVDLQISRHELLALNWNSAYLLTHYTLKGMMGVFDLLIKNGMIVDGTGRKAYRGDIGIIGGRIVEIGECIGHGLTQKNSQTNYMTGCAFSRAKEIIDATGLIVCPGFIDVHSHNDLVPFMEEYIQELKLYQGVTTELIGQCGLGIIPCGEGQNDENWRNYTRGVVGSTDTRRDFQDVESYFHQILSCGLKNNFAVLISHGAVKSKVMGFDKGTPTAEQLEEMCCIVSMAMEAGALGMSLGLQYMPGIYSGRDELVELCRIVKSYDGIVMVHLRNHDSTIILAMEEMISIARLSGVKLHISHLRSYNSQSLGCKAEELIKAVDSGTQSGVDITFDEHLYLSGSTLLTQLLPPWVSSNVQRDMEDIRKMNRENGKENSRENSRENCKENSSESARETGSENIDNQELEKYASEQDSEKNIDRNDGAKNEGQAELIKNLKSVEIRERIKNELDNHEIHYTGWDNYYGVTGWDNILITSVKSDENAKCVGKTVGELAKDLNIHPVDFVAELLVKEQGGVGIVTLDVFSEEDTIELINHPLQMVGSDSIPAGTPHPRLYGNYPLFFGKFVRRECGSGHEDSTKSGANLKVEDGLKADACSKVEDVLKPDVCFKVEDGIWADSCFESEKRLKEVNLLSVENAVYKVTLLPAKTLRLQDVGELAVNKLADITIFDFDEMKGFEDYRNPRTRPMGIKHVILNGQIVLKDGVVLDNRIGRVLRHKNHLQNIEV